MHDFVSYLFYLLQRGMRFAVPAALICGLILAVCYTVCRSCLLYTSPSPRDRG